VKDIEWVGRSREALREFPQDVRRTMGFALREAQRGDKNERAKPLKGFGGAGVLEIVDDFDSDTYRTMYTVRFVDTVYVLHAIQKKSTHGIETPQREMDTVRRNLVRVEQVEAERTKARKEQE
jgi:phage-related protein